MYLLLIKSKLKSALQNSACRMFLILSGWSLAVFSMLSVSVRVECFAPPVLVLSALPFSLFYLVASAVLLSLLVAFGNRSNLDYVLCSGTQLATLYFVAFFDATTLIRIGSLSLTIYDEHTQQLLLVLPALIYFSSWLRATRKFSNLKECLPTALSSLLLLALYLYSPQSLTLIWSDLCLTKMPRITPPSVATGALFVLASTFVGLRRYQKASKEKLSAVLTLMPAFLIALSGSIAAKTTAYIIGYYDHILHSLFPLHFNLFVFLSFVSFMGGLAVLSTKRAELAASIFCILFAISYPVLHRVMTKLLIPVSFEPAPLVWLPVALISLILFRPHSFIKSSFLAIALVALVAQPLVTTYPSEIVNPFMLSAKEAEVRDKIDPSIINMEQPPEALPVILRFPHPVNEDVLSELNMLPYFKISRHNETPAIYSSNVGFVYGVINTSLCDWREASKFLVEKFGLKYLLLDRGIDPSQIISLHPITYSVDADVLHSLNITGRGVTVAVIDSGINDADPEITGKNEGRIIYQVNFITRMEGDPALVGDLTPTDGKYHGTFVARTIAGVRGIAPHANLIDLKVQLEMGEMYYDTSLRIIEAIEWCIKNKDRFNISVINLSMGNREGTGGTIDKAVNKAVLAGITVVAAAGTW
ncbi:MAG: S8 family serine peptidase, partial [Candidatus Jordarchaeales archaeon]